MYACACVCCSLPCSGDVYTLSRGGVGCVDIDSYGVWYGTVGYGPFRFVLTLLSLWTPKRSELQLRESKVNQIPNCDRNKERSGAWGNRREIRLRKFRQREETQPYDTKKAKGANCIRFDGEHCGWPVWLGVTRSFSFPFPSLLVVSLFRSRLTFRTPEKQLSTRTNSTPSQCNKTPTPYQR